MSKIGSQPIRIPEGVSVKATPSAIEVIGPKGTLARELPRGIEIKIEEKEITVSSKGKSKKARSLWGTFRAILFGMVEGVSRGWEKKLELVGAGYRAEVAGSTLSLSVGYSHPVKMEAPEGITFAVEKTVITVSGADKEMVGLTAARIRAVRPPEPYKGKGIKYLDEVIRRKVGKAAKAAGAPA